MQNPQHNCRSHNTNTKATTQVRPFRASVPYNFDLFFLIAQSSLGMCGAFKVLDLSLVKEVNIDI